MKMLTLKVPEALDAELERAAQERGATKSLLVRCAIAEHLGGKRSTGASFLAAASDLAGIISAARDLSTHPRHLRGYGR